MTATAIHTHDGMRGTEQCPACGRSTFLITIRASACFTVSRCPQCDRRAWTIDGLDASLADVLTTLRREQLALVPRRRP